VIISGVLTDYDRRDQPVRKFFYYNSRISRIKEKEKTDNFLTYLTGGSQLANQTTCHFKNQQPLGGTYLQPLDCYTSMNNDYLLELYIGESELIIVQKTITKEE